MDFTTARFTAHAMERIHVRGVGLSTIRKVLTAPDAALPGRGGRVVVQKRIRIGPARAVYLVRVVVDVDRRPPEIVTAYRTRRFARYEGPLP